MKLQVETKDRMFLNVWCLVNVIARDLKSCITDMYCEMKATGTSSERFNVCSTFK